MKETLIRMHKNADIKYFPVWRKRYKKEKRIPLVVSLITNNGKILDIGARWGDVTNEIYKQNKDVIGMDFVPEFVEMAKKFYPYIDFKEGDVTLIPFENETFDTIVMSEVIEHILDQDVAIQEVFRVLKSDGEFILTTPNIASLRNRLKLLMGHPIETDIVHFNVLAKKQLISLLERNGFIIKIVKGDNIRISKLKLPCFYTNLSDTFIVKVIKKNEL